MEINSYFGNQAKLMLKCRNRFPWEKHEFNLGWGKNIFINMPNRIGNIFGAFPKSKC